MTGGDRVARSAGYSPGYAGTHSKHDHYEAPWGGFLVVMIICVALAVISVIELVRGSEAADRLALVGVPAEASRCEQRIGPRIAASPSDPRTAVDAVRVTFEADGRRVTAELARMHTGGHVDPDLSSGWYEVPPDANSYACPIQVIYDPADPTTVMAAKDVQSFRSANVVPFNLIILGISLLGLTGCFFWGRSADRREKADARAT